MGKYAALTAMGTFMILSPKKAQFQVLMVDRKIKKCIVKMLFNIIKDLRKYYILFLI